ncbi:MAG: F0F1 ATP synthase subunit B [Christensenellaceae bacterium]|jgi:F-type H+-transporting ATPase subunit b|nr:F0F1 ATP synthase subunit B [Christensenellaceae bacterium]
MGEIFNLPSLALHMLNALILFIAIRVFLYKPVRKFLRQREESVAQTLKNADASAKEADRLLAQSREELLCAQNSATETIAQGAKRAQGSADEILAGARIQAEEIIQKAQQEAEQIRLAAREAMAEEASNLAVAIASKILEREVTLQDNKKLIEEFLEEVG